MPGGPELVIIVVFALMAALLVLALRNNARRAALPTEARTAAVPIAAREWLPVVAADLASLSRHSVQWLSPDVLQVTLTRRSGWVFVVALISFPIGLLALLFTMTEHGTIVVVDDGPPGRVTFGGQFSGAAVDAVNAYIPD